MGTDRTVVTDATVLKFQAISTLSVDRVLIIVDQ